MSNLQFGAELKIGGQETSVSAEQKVKELKESIIDLAAKFSQGEISQQEFSAGLKDLTGQLRANEQAARILTAAAREQAAASEHATAEVYDLADAYDLLEHESTTVVTTSQQIGQAMKGEAVAINQVEVAAARTSTATARLGTTKDATAKSTRNLGLAALEASRGLEDLQYGVGGLINNLPNLVMYLGGPAGVGAAISGLTVGSYVLAKNWGTLTEAFSNTAPIRDVAGQIDDLEAKIKEFEGRKIRLVVDQVQLDEAKSKLDELKSGLAEFERQRSQQSKAEQEAGKNVQELLTESTLGAPEIEARLADRQKQQNLANSQPLQKALADQERARKEIESAQNDMRFAASPGAAQAAQGRLARGQSLLDQSKADESAARSAAETGAKSQVGDMLKQAREGNGLDQANARRNLVEGLQGIGQGGLANQVALQTPQAARDKAAAKQAEDIDKAALQVADKAAKDKQAAQDKLGKATLKQIEQWSEEAYQAFLVEDAARKKLAKVNKQKADAEFDAAVDELVAETKEAERREAAESKRIQAAAGKEARGEFGAEVANRAEATGGDPEQIAVKLATELAQAFQRMGNTRGGSDLAAQQIAAGAGFRVTPQQLFEARQPAPRQPVARARPAAGKRVPKIAKVPKAKPVAQAPKADPRAAKSEAQILADRKAAAANAAKAKATRAAAAQPPGPQASLVPALAQPIAATQQAVAQIAAQQARDHAIIAALNQRARLLTNRNVEGTTTALNSGSRTA